MYMQEALEAVCKKRKLNPNEYALLVRDMSILIPLDRTVASLEGKSDLLLVKRSWLPRYGIVEKSTRTTDPNGKPSQSFLSTRWLTFPPAASIFKRMSETPGAQNLFSAMDYTGAYKVWPRAGVSLTLSDLDHRIRNMSLPGSCPCLSEGTRGSWRSTVLTSTYAPFPSALEYNKSHSRPTDHAIGQTGHGHVRNRPNVLIPHQVRRGLPTIGQIIFVFQARRAPGRGHEEVRFRGGESESCE